MKKVLSLMIVAAMTAAFVACGGSNAEREKQIADSTAAANVADSTAKANTADSITKATATVDTSANAAAPATTTP